MVMPSLASVDHHVEHLVDHLRVERRGRLVEEHHLGVHRQRPGDGDPLLLAAGELRPGSLSAWSATPTRSSSSRARFSASALDSPRDLDRAERDVLEHRLVREQVERLEHHADVGAQLGQSLPSSGSGWPSMLIVPLSMVSSRLIVRHSVDLPEPDGPMTTTTSPWWTVRSMSFSTCRSPKCLLTLSRTTSGLPGPVAAGRSGRYPGQSCRRKLSGGPPHSTIRRRSRDRSDATADVSLPTS